MNYMTAAALSFLHQDSTTTSSGAALECGRQRRTEQGVRQTKKQTVPGSPANKELAVTKALMIFNY
jgi:hypothetical protein